MPKRRRWRNYPKYLRTAHWQQLRARKLKLAYYKCEWCGSVGPLNVHHRTYTTLGRERHRDLVVLCEECHEAVHVYHRERPWLSLAQATEYVRRVRCCVR